MEKFIEILKLSKLTQIEIDNISMSNKRFNQSSETSQQKHNAKWHQW